MIRVLLGNFFCIMKDKKERDMAQIDWQEDGSVGLGRQAFEFIVELIKVVLISLAIIIPVRYFLIQPFYVKGASMEPNFYDNQYLIINEISYRFSDPDRGDIVVFKYPLDPSQYFIKRVVGLPGETIEVKEGQVLLYNDSYSDGIVVGETYLEEGDTTNGEDRVVLEDDQYYVLGDNRDSSLDSRRFGPIKRKNIVGKVWFRGWPFTEFKVFESPSYNL